MLFKLALLLRPVSKQLSYLTWSCEQWWSVFGWKALFVHHWTFAQACCSTFAFLHSSWQNQSVVDWQAHGIVIPSSLPHLLVFPLPTLGSKVSRFKNDLVAGLTTVSFTNCISFSCLRPFQVILGTHTFCVTHPWVPAKLGKKKGQDCWPRPREAGLCPWKGNSFFSRQNSSSMFHSFVEFKFFFCF